MMKFQNFLVDSTTLVVRGSVVLAFLLLFIQIGEKFKNQPRKFLIFFLSFVQQVWNDERAQDEGSSRDQI